MYNQVKDQDSKEYSALYKRIKENNEDSKILAGILYEAAYICCLAELAYDQKKQNESQNIRFLQEFCDIEEFIYAMDEAIFDDLCDDFLYFLYSDLYTKKRMLSFIPSDDEYLKKAYPCYLLDLLFYSNKLDASMLIEGYYDRLNKGDKTAFFNSVEAGVEELFMLEAEDFFSYKYIILDMLESAYKYYKYLLENNLLNNQSVREIIEQIDFDLTSFIYLWSKDKNVLRIIIEGYLKYNILSVNDIENIDNYFKSDEKKKAISKVLKKCNKLKNEN